jgi:hypothetical protein
MATDTASTPTTGSPEARAAITARTLRTDRWWLTPLIYVFGLGAFIVYSTYAVLVGDHFFIGERAANAHGHAPYISPFYSPCLAGDACGPVKTPVIGNIFDGMFFLSRLVVLMFPLAFRTTCYYYRKAYYRSFWLSPPACAVAEPHKKYTGETRFPLVLQNIHRYFFYAAIVVAGILTYDTVLSFRNEDYQWGHMGLGTLVFLLNITLIWLYTLSCHSCRHIVGGKLKHFSKHPVRYRMWQWVGKLNARHMLLAWASLVSVALADFYVYLVASGAFDDPRFF